MKRPEHAGIVIVGGGCAGGWAAKTLRDRGYSGRLTVVSDEPYDFYERPPLSKAALLDAAAPLSRLFSEQTVAELNIDWRRRCAPSPLMQNSKSSRSATGNGCSSSSC